MNDIPDGQLPPPRRESSRPTTTRRSLLFGAGAALVVGLGSAAAGLGDGLPGQRGALRD